MAFGVGATVCKGNVSGLCKTSLHAIRSRVRSPRGHGLAVQWLGGAHVVCVAAWCAPSVATLADSTQGGSGAYCKFCCARLASALLVAVVPVQGKGVGFSVFFGGP